jgi:DNA-binding MurR/RpiR family transcriptional regulator
VFNIDATKLNPLERTVLDALSLYAKTNDPPGIVEAARVCGCSVSQVSKAIKKAGFGGYKQYIRYLYFGEYPKQESLAELERLKRVIDEFDVALVDEMVDLIRRHEKIILFGYGPSFICAQYFEYKLRFCTDDFIATPPDENSVRNMVDEKSLLIILTTTGQFRSFEDVSGHAKSRGADVVVISEEFNSALMDNCDRYFVLSHHNQPDSLLPHEKTRTVFFIFLEQVVQRILAIRKQKDSDPSA